MDTLPLIAIALFLVLVLYWAMLKGSTRVRIIIASVSLAGTACIGFHIGQAWERLRNYDQYVYRFGQYSSYLRQLAEHRDIAKLTNSVILFDKEFNPHQRASDLQDVMFKLMQLGPYYQGTNGTVGVTGQN